jgi:hypothetical protein
MPLVQQIFILKLAYILLLSFFKNSFYATSILRGVSGRSPCEYTLRPTELLELELAHITTCTDIMVTHLTNGFDTGT